MPTFVCKHYRRSAAGATTGTLTNEWQFSASSVLEAEGKIRRMLGVAPPVDWKMNFATLEDELGQELAVWHHGLLHS